MNNMQKIVSAITGYEESDLGWSSARDDYYYELETVEEKIQHVMELSQNSDDFDTVDYNTAKKLVDYVTAYDAANQNESIKIFYSIQ